MGVPEMDTLWKSLTSAEAKKQLDADGQRLLRTLRKALVLIADNPRHPSLQSHEIAALSKRYGVKVWQSYLENRKPAAGRLFWVYGPDRAAITIVALEPHPDDKKSSYEKVVLSSVRLTTPPKPGKRQT